MKNIFLKQKQRNKNGAAVFELAITLPFVIAVSILSLDLIALMFGADLGDRACKDCARVAGQMPTPDEAVNAMNAIAKGHPIDGNIIHQMYPELIVYRDFNNSSKPTPPYGKTKSYLGNNGPNDIEPLGNDDPNDGVKNKTNHKGTDLTNPYVVVRVSVFVKMPVAISLFGFRLFNGNVPNDPDLFEFQSEYTYPITNTYVSTPEYF